MVDTGTASGAVVGGGVVGGAVVGGLVVVGPFPFPLPLPEEPSFTVVVGPGVVVEVDVVVDDPASIEENRSPDATEGGGGSRNVPTSRPLDTSTMNAFQMLAGMPPPKAGPAPRS